MRECEANILRQVSELLNAHTDRLSALGITWRGPEIEVWQSEQELYTSELRVTIVRDGRLDDVLEFHLFRGGELLVTAEEVTKWFHEQLNDLR